MGTLEHTKHKGWTWIMAMPMAEVHKAGVDFDPNNRTVKAIQGDAASGSALEVLANGSLSVVTSASIVLGELIHCGNHVIGASIGHSCYLCFAGIPIELLCKGLFANASTDFINSILHHCCHAVACSRSCSRTCSLVQSRFCLLDSYTIHLMIYVLAMSVSSLPQPLTHPCTAHPTTNPPSDPTFLVQFWTSCLCLMPFQSHDACCLQNSPHCADVFLLSPGVSEFTFPAQG